MCPDARSPSALSWGRCMRAELPGVCKTPLVPLTHKFCSCLLSAAQATCGMHCRASARRALCLGIRSECALPFGLNVHITGAVPAQDVRLHTPETLLCVDLISVASTYNMVAVVCMGQRLQKILCAGYMYVSIRRPTQATARLMVRGWKIVVQIACVLHIINICTAQTHAWSCKGPEDSGGDSARTAPPASQAHHPLRPQVRQRAPHARWHRKNRRAPGCAQDLLRSLQLSKADMLGVRVCSYSSLVVCACTVKVDTCSKSLLAGSQNVA